MGKLYLIYSYDDLQVEYVVEPVDSAAFVEQRRVEDGWYEVAMALQDNEAEIQKLDSEIAIRTNYAERIDYVVAVGSGVLAGILDSVFVGSFSLERAEEWGTARIDSFVEYIANKEGFKGEGITEAVKFLEEEYPFVGDKAINAFGGGFNHHLRDFSHHPTIIGMVFSVLTQFTGKVYGTDVHGKFIEVPISEADYILIGDNVPEKLMYGTIR